MPPMEGVGEKGCQKTVRSGYMIIIYLKSKSSSPSSLRSGISTPTRGALWTPCKLGDMEGYYGEFTKQRHRTRNGRPRTKPRDSLKITLMRGHLRPRSVPRIRHTTNREARHLPSLLLYRQLRRGPTGFEPARGSRPMSAPRDSPVGCRSGSRRESLAATVQIR